MGDLERYEVNALRRDAEIDERNDRERWEAEERAQADRAGMPQGVDLRGIER